MQTELLPVKFVTQGQVNMRVFHVITVDFVNLVVSDLKKGVGVLCAERELKML